MIDANTFRLDGRLALVTGSSAGIGLALARGLGQAGATVVLNGRDAARLAVAERALRAEGLAVHALGFDVTESASVIAAIETIERDIGAIEILVNNAGMQRRAAFQDYDAADWRLLMQTNVDSVFHVGQAVARKMIPRGRGRIINVCSVQSELGRPNIAPYAATKGAVKMLTKGMAIDLGPFGINVNGIGPGYYNTDLGNSLATFARDHLGTVDHRTTVIILGDGRNNYNDPNLRDFEDIKRRARKVVWFNPEHPRQWGTGDSDMPKYVPLCDAVHQVSNLRQLVDAVDSLFLRR